MYDLYLLCTDQRLSFLVQTDYYHIFVVNMTDANSSEVTGPLVAFLLYVIQSGSEILSGKGVGWKEGTRNRERGRERERLELMVLHLPGSMSIMALITLNKESISLFSFLLHATQQKHRRRLKSSSNAVCLHVTDTSFCSLLDQNKMTWEIYLWYNPLYIHIFPFPLWCVSIFTVWVSEYWRGKFPRIFITQYAT